MPAILKPVEATRSKDCGNDRQRSTGEQEGIMEHTKGKSNNPELLFGQFLVNEHAVNESDVVEALNIQKERTTPIGQLALKNNMLTMQKIFAILNAQVNSSKRFGEVAVELGYLSKESVDVLLNIQKEGRPPIGEILVEINKLDRNTLENLLEKYRQLGK